MYMWTGTCTSCYIHMLGLLIDINHCDMAMKPSWVYLIAAPHQTLEQIQAMFKPQQLIRPPQSGRISYPNPRTNNINLKSEKLIRPLHSGRISHPIIITITITIIIIIIISTVIACRL
jgi:hypothetical protein